MFNEQIRQYINSQPEPKRADMQALHLLLLTLLPNGKLWFEDGLNSDGKVVSNPTIGYGQYSIHYANGKSSDFFQIGLSANSTGISLYIMGIKGKLDLAKAYGETLGKASVTGYCIKFKKLADINLDVLSAAILAGVETSAKG